MSSLGFSCSYLVNLGSCSGKLILVLHTVCGYKSALNSCLLPTFFKPDTEQERVLVNINQRQFMMTKYFKMCEGRDKLLKCLAKVK